MNRKSYALFVVLCAAMVMLFSATALAVSFSLSVGEYLDMDDAYPSNVIVTNVTSSNSSVVGVSGTYIYGVGSGSASITVTSYTQSYPYYDDYSGIGDGVGVLPPEYDVFDVTVYSPVPVPTPSPVYPDVTTTISLFAGQTQDIGVSLYSVSQLSSSNPSVASAYGSNGRVFVNGNSSGNCTIYGTGYTTAGQAYAQNITIYVTVRQNQTTYNDTANMRVGDTGYSDMAFSRISNVSYSNSSIARAFYQNNRLCIQAMNAGSTVITADGVDTSGNSVKITINVYVTALPTPVPTPAPAPINETMNMSLSTGEKSTLGAKYVSVSNIQSTDPAVAQASFSGNKLTVSGRAAGSATITCSAKKSGAATTGSLTIYVSVTDSSSSNSQGITFSVKSPVNAKVGKRYTIKTVKVDGVKVNATQLKWGSSDEDIVTVDKTGKFSCLKAGTAYITCETKGGDEYAELKVIVKK